MFWHTDFTTFSAELGNTFHDRVGAKHHNNLNGIRLLLAVLVILSHSYPLSGNGSDALAVYSHDTTSFGAIAVDLFFVISGFLITASWLNCRSMSDYFRRRLLRIVPGYLLAVIFSLTLAMALAAHPLADLSARLGQLKDFTTLGDQPLRGAWVFPDNPFPKEANGSLWTIPWEFDCYVLVAFMGLFGLFKRREIILAAVLIFFLYHGFSIYHGVNVDFNSRRFITYFLAGACAWLWRDKLAIDYRLALGAVGILVVGLLVKPWFAMLFPVAGCYLVLWLAYAFRAHSLAWCDRVDLSYGVYLYAFPVQQALAHWNVRSPLEMFLLATPLVMLMAWGSWTLVEKPCLKLKSRDFSDYDPALQAAPQPPPATAAAQADI